MATCNNVTVCIEVEVDTKKAEAALRKLKRISLRMLLIEFVQQIIDDVKAVLKWR